MTIGSTTATIAAAMTRLRPSTSAIAPVNGAVSAMASVLAVMMVLIAAAPTPNSRASAGSSACGEYRLRKAQKPAVATANLPGVEAHCGSLPALCHWPQRCDRMAARASVSAGVPEASICAQSRLPRS